MTRTYRTEELFKDIPEDPDHILLTIPQELVDSLGWKENDEVTVHLKNNSLYITKTNEKIRD